MGFECTFLRPQRKRGPTGNRVSRIWSQQNQPLPQHPADRDGECPSKSPSEQAFDFTETEIFSTKPIANSGCISHPEIGRSAHDNELGQSASYTAGSDHGAGIPASSQDHTGMNWNEWHDIEYWLPDNLGTQTPTFYLPGSNLHVKPSLPPIVQTDIQGTNFNQDPDNEPNVPLSDLPVFRHQAQHIGTTWPSSVNEANLIPWIDVYFDRLHPTLPILNKSILFTRILSQEHRHDPQFGSMLLSLCAFALTQPINISEQPTSSTRATQSKMMMDEATKLRSTSDFGECPTLEAILTSFFLFACLFGSNQHNAAWLRLREAVDLAVTLGLNDPDSYHSLTPGEKSQRLRTYLVLSITERAYALQRQHPINFRGKPGISMLSTDFLYNASDSIVSGTIVHSEQDAAGMIGLALLMELFDAIDEDIVGCWNGSCDAGYGRCQKLNESRMLTIHENLRRVSDIQRYRSNYWFDLDGSLPGPAHTGTANSLRGLLRETQCADVLVTQKWLENRIWHLCFSHGLLRIDSNYHELRPSYALFLAESTLGVCQSLRISSLEAHGIGLIEKLYDIAVSASTNPYSSENTFISNYCVHPNPSETEVGSGVPSSLGGLSTRLSSSASRTSIHNLANGFLKVLSTLRGGNHPYLDQFKVHVKSMTAVGNERTTGWSQG